MAKKKYIIERDGKEIELTPMECANLYIEMDKAYTREDLLSRLEEGNIDDIPPMEEISVSDIEDLLDKALEYMVSFWDDNDNRGDIYWSAREMSLEKAWKDIYSKK